MAGARRESPRVFESDEYQRRRAEITQQLQSQREAVLDGVRAEAERLGFTIEFTPMGVATVPLLEPGRALSQEGFELLPEEKKAQIRLNGQELTGKTEEVLVSVRRLERQAHEQLRVRSGGGGLRSRPPAGYAAREEQ